MRTAIDLEDDTVMAAKESARAENTSLGKVSSRWLRLALTGGVAPQTINNLPATATGFVPFGSRGVVVSNELINRLRDADGI